MGGWDPLSCWTCFRRDSPGDWARPGNLSCEFAKARISKEWYDLESSCLLLLLLPLLLDVPVCCSRRVIGLGGFAFAFALSLWHWENRTGTGTGCCSRGGDAGALGIVHCVRCYFLFPYWLGMSGCRGGYEARSIDEGVKGFWNDGSLMFRHLLWNWFLCGSNFSSCLDFFNSKDNMFQRWVPFFLFFFLSSRLVLISVAKIDLHFEFGACCPSENTVAFPNVTAFNYVLNLWLFPGI